MQRIREMLMTDEDEELILIDQLLGVIRQNADVRPAVFNTENLSMLLRQAVVAVALKKTYITLRYSRHIYL